MRLCSITSVKGGYRISTYNVEHGDRSRLKASSALSGTPPSVFSEIGNHHFGGTPRSRHFSTVRGLTPKSAAARFTKLQSSDVMPVTITDISSEMQRRFVGRRYVGVDVPFGMLGETDRERILRIKKQMQFQLRLNNLTPNKFARLPGAGRSSIEWPDLHSEVAGFDRTLVAQGAYQPQP